MAEKARAIAEAEELRSEVEELTIEHDLALSKLDRFERELGVKSQPERSSEEIESLRLTVMQQLRTKHKPARIDQKNFAQLRRKVNQLKRVRDSLLQTQRQEAQRQNELFTDVFGLGFLLVLPASIHQLF